MSDGRLAASCWTAAIALVLALADDVGLVGLLGVDPLVTGVSALVLAIAAFALSVTSGSRLVSGMLIIQGVANVSAAMAAGATVGVPFGLVVLLLGLVEGVVSRRKGRAEAMGARPPMVG